MGRMIKLITFIFLIGLVICFSGIAYPYYSPYSPSPKVISPSYSYSVGEPKSPGDTVVLYKWVYDGPTLLYREDVYGNRLHYKYGLPAYEEDNEGNVILRYVYSGSSLLYTEDQYYSRTYYDYRERPTKTTYMYDTPEGGTIELVAKEYHYEDGRLVEVINYDLPDEALLSSPKDEYDILSIAYYDDKERVSKVVYQKDDEDIKKGDTRIYYYVAGNRIDYITDGSGKKLHQYYYEDGKLVREESWDNKEGKLSTIYYDDKGRPDYADGEGGRTDWVYEGARLVKIQYPDTPSTPFEVPGPEWDDGKYITYTYDGSTLRGEDQYGNFTEYTVSGDAGGGPNWDTFNKYGRKEGEMRSEGGHWSVQVACSGHKYAELDEYGNPTGNICEFIDVEYHWEGDRLVSSTEYSLVEDPQGEAIAKDPLTGEIRHYTRVAITETIYKHFPGEGDDKGTDKPIEVRSLRPGEEGTVLSTYNYDDKGNLLTIYDHTTGNTYYYEHFPGKDEDDKGSDELMYITNSEGAVIRRFERDEYGQLIKQETLGEGGKVIETIYYDDKGREDYATIRDEETGEEIVVREWIYEGDKLTQEIEYGYQTTPFGEEFGITFVTYYDQFGRAEKIEFYNLWSYTGSLTLTVSVEDDLIIFTNTQTGEEVSILAGGDGLDAALLDLLSGLSEGATITVGYTDGYLDWIDTDGDMGTYELTVSRGDSHIVEQVSLVVSGEGQIGLSDGVKIDVAGLNGVESGDILTFNYSYGRISSVAEDDTSLITYGDSNSIIVVASGGGAVTLSDGTVIDLSLPEYGVEAGDLILFFWEDDLLRIVNQQGTPDDLDDDITIFLEQLSE